MNLLGWILLVLMGLFILPVLAYILAKVITAAVIITKRQMKEMQQPDLRSMDDGKEEDE